MGSGLTATGGVLRHQGVNAAWEGHKNIPGFSWRHIKQTYPAGRLLRSKARGRRRYLVGAAAGLVGAPAVAVGGTQLLRSNKRVEKSLLGRRQPDKMLRRANLATMQPSDAEISRSGHENKLYVNRKRVIDYSGMEDGSLTGLTFRGHGEFGRRSSGETTLWEKATGAYPPIRESRWGHRAEFPAWATSSYRPLMKRPRVRGALALAGVAGVGEVTRHRVKKSDHRAKSFLREGAAGATDALGQRVASARESPPQAKAVPTAIGLGAGTLGSLAAHRSLDRVDAFKHGRLHSGRAGITATAGTLAAAGSFPLARRALAHNKEYEVTPAGVRRRKTVPVRPSKQARRIDARDHSFRTRQQIVPSTRVGKAIGPKTDARAAALLHRLEERQQRDYGHLGSRRAMFEAYQRDHPTAHSDLFWRAALVKANRRIDPMDREESRKALVDHLQRHQRARMDTALLRRDLGVPSTPPKRRIYKADYPGRHFSGNQQRAATYAAGATPLVGSLAAAHVAAHFAPPGQQRRAAGRQFVGGPGVGLAGGVAGAYGMAHAADKYARVQHAAEQAASAHAKVRSKLPHLPKIKSTRGAAAKEKAVGRLRGTKLVEPLMRRKLAAGVGFVAGRVVAGQTGGNIAINRNLAAQRRYNAKHPVEKLAGDPAPLRTKRQQTQQLRRKQRAIATGVLATSAGLVGTGLLAARHTPRLSQLAGSKLERAAIHTSIIGGGVGAVNGIQNQRIARRDIKQQRHDLGVAKAWPQLRQAPAGVGRARSYHRSGFRHSAGGRLVRVRAGLR